MKYVKSLSVTLAFLGILWTFSVWPAVFAVAACAVVVGGVWTVAHGFMYGSDY